MFESYPRQDFFSFLLERSKFKCKATLSTLGNATNNIKSIFKKKLDFKTSEKKLQNANFIKLKKFI